MQLHPAIDDKVLEVAFIIAWGMPRSASEQERSHQVRRIPRGEILHVSEHVSRRSWVICSVIQVYDCSR